jgi:hypothetical protein
MKLVSTFVQPELVGRVVDMLRTLGYTHVGLGHEDPAAAPDGSEALVGDEPGHPSVRVEVLVKEVDAPGAAVALSRATSKDPHPVLVTEVSPMAFVGEPSRG